MTPNKNTTRLMDQDNTAMLNVSECGILDLKILQVGLEKRDKNVKILIKILKNQ